VTLKVSVKLPVLFRRLTVFNGYYPFLPDITRLLKNFVHSYAEHVCLHFSVPLKVSDKLPVLFRRSTVFNGYYPFLPDITRLFRMSSVS